jgi:hypothetical protein
MWKLVGYLYREVCNAMESMCAAANTISFKPFTHGRHVWTAETCVSHDHDPQWLFPRALFRGLQFHKLGGYHSFAALLQVLIASFAKILSAVSAQAESEQTRRTKHGCPVVAGVARNIPTAQPTRLPLQLFQFFVYLGERFDGEFQVFARMRGGDLRTHTRGANWNNRIEESDHVNAFL